MNEITKIHLGRQAFTISVDAYHELRSYLNAIQKQVGDSEVVNEIELRMAELLAEHGIDAGKVMLPADVKLLKEQLGNPTEFKEDNDASTTPDPQSTDKKKLYRDTDHAIVAGVAAGLANYFEIEVLFIRLLFVFITAVTVGWGILLYILLWLLVPEAKTSSDRLQMVGKPITVTSIKDAVNRADVKGAARRANTTVARTINTMFHIILKLIGLSFIIVGLSILFSLVAGAIYFYMNNGVWQLENSFPVGLREHILLDIAAVIIGLFAVCIILIGLAIFRRKWPIRAWVTGVLIGLILTGIAAGGALAADVYPDVRDRYTANYHTTLRTLPPFNTVSAAGDGINSITYDVSDKYYVAIRYFDNPNLASFKTTVKNGTLYIDSSQFNWHRDCRTICIPDSFQMDITIYAPNAFQLESQDTVTPPLPPAPVDSNTP